MTRSTPLRRPAFRALWLAGLISDTGDWLLFIALPIVVYQLTGSALGTSLTFLFELGPGIVLAPVAGWLVDSFDRRRILVVVTVLQAVALLPLLSVTDRGDLPTIYLVVIVEAILFTMFDPAKNALMPTLLEPEELVAANSLIGLNQNLGRLVGGPLGGLLLAAGDLRLIVGIDFVTFLLAGAFLLRVRTDSPDSKGKTPAARSEQANAGSAGYRAALRGTQVRAGLLVAFMSQVAQGLFVVLFILFVAQRLHGGSAEIGLLRGVQAIGAIAGGIALTMLARAVSPGALTAWAATTFAVIDLVLWNGPTVTTVTWLYVLLFILIGVPGILLATGMISTLQAAAVDRTRGRVFSVYGLACNAGQAIGMLAGGLLTVPLGLLSLLNIQATLYLVTGAIAGIWLRGRRGAVVVPNPALDPVDGGDRALRPATGE